MIMKMVVLVFIIITITINDHNNNNNTNDNMVISVELRSKLTFLLNSTILKYVPSLSNVSLFHYSFDIFPDTRDRSIANHSIK